jgi:hypothetical protein
MKAFLLSAVAAVGLACGFSPQQASAAWAYRDVTSWDPACGRYVVVTERYWVPDPPVVVASPPVVVVPSVSVGVGFRGYPYYHHHYHHHH